MEMIFSLCRLLTCFVNNDEGFAGDMPKVCECLFVQAVYWSVGGCVDGPSRITFNEYMVNLLTGEAAELPAHLDFVNKNRSYYDRSVSVCSAATTSISHLGTGMDGSLIVYRSYHSTQYLVCLTIHLVHFPPRLPLQPGLCGGAVGTEPT